MGRKHKKNPTGTRSSCPFLAGRLRPIQYRLCVFVYQRRALHRHLTCLCKSFCEVYRILNPDTDCRT